MDGKYNLVRASMKVAREINPHFTIDEQNREVLRLLFQYIFRMPEFEEEGNETYSLDKGIMLIGPYGTGKTELMRIMQRIYHYLNSDRKFKFRVTWELANEFLAEGEIKIRGGNYFFDEMGMDTREKVTYFGNTHNIANDIILTRYNEFIDKGHITHFTSNKKMEYLKEYLGGREYDRLHEMCNVIELRGESRRKDAVPRPKPSIKKDKSSSEDQVDFYQFCKSMIIENPSSPVIPYTVIYDSGVKLGHIKNDLYEYEEIYQQKKIEAYSALELKLSKVYDGLERDRMNKVLLSIQNEPDNIEVKRLVCKELVLKSLNLK